MEKNGRIPFKDKVHFRKKIDETWYRTGSHESPETYTEQEERNATRYERIPTHAKHQPELGNEDYYTQHQKREIKEQNIDELDNSQHYARSETSGISKHYARSLSSRGEISQHNSPSVASGISKHYARSVSSRGEISQHYSPSDASGISKHYGGSTCIQGDISKQYAPSDASGISKFYSSSDKMDKHLGKSLNPIDAPREITGISKYFDPAPSEISGISKHYAQSEISEISKDYAHSDAGGISRHYAGSDSSDISRHLEESIASGISKHYKEFSESGSSIGDISKFYDDVDISPDESRRFVHSTIPMSEPTIENELSKFNTPKQKKKSRFQYPEVSKLWFFQQNKNEHFGNPLEVEEQEQYMEHFNDPVPKHQIESVPSEEREESEGGDDVLFDPNAKGQKEDIYDPDDEKTGMQITVRLEPEKSELKTASPGRTASTIGTNASPVSSTGDDLLPTRAIEFTSNESLLSNSYKSYTNKDKPKLFRRKKVLIGSCVFLFIVILVVVAMIIVWVYKGFPEISREKDKSFLPEKEDSSTIKSPNWVRITLSPTESPLEERGSEDLGDFEEIAFIPRRNTFWPSLRSSASPTNTPSMHSSLKPSLSPSSPPSPLPSGRPSRLASNQPSSSFRPTQTPSLMHSGTPSQKPSILPSEGPSTHPSLRPSQKPSSHPSNKPSQYPSISPSATPSVIPTIQSSVEPSISFFPSMAPTLPKVTSFYVTGGRFDDLDVFNPYRVVPLTKALQAIPDDTSFFVHLGDFNNPKETSCKVESYSHYRSNFDESPVLALMVVGANDISNCPNPVTSMVLWKTYFSGVERNWRRSGIVVRRQELRETNFAFVKRRILFFSISFYYSDTESILLERNRNTDNMNWAKEVVAHYDDEFDKIVFFGNDSAFDDNYDVFFGKLEEDVLRFFPVPTLYVYQSQKGKNKISNKNFNSKNIWSLEVAGESLPFLKVSVDDLEESSPFTFEVDWRTSF